MYHWGKGVDKVDPKFLFITPSDEASFVAIGPAIDTRFDLVYPSRCNCLFAQGKRHKRPRGVFVDGINLCLHSDLPLGIVVGLVKYDGVSLIVGKKMVVSGCVSCV